MKKTLHVLIAEDSPNDAEMVLHTLRRAGFDPQWKRVETEPDYLAELKNSPDIVLSDYSMPQFSGLRAVKLLQESGRDIPFILISGMAGEEAAVEAMRHGATDYLLKDRMARLGAAVEQALEKKRLRDERRRAEESLNLFRNLVDRSSDGVEVIDPDTGRFLDVNETTCARLGYQRAELLAIGVLDIDDAGMDLASWRNSVAMTRQSGFRVLETRHKRKDGSTFPVEVSVRFVKLDCDYLIASVRDITERKRAEKSLQETSALLETLFQTTADYIYFKDLQSRFVRASVATLKHFNLARPDELAGRTDFDFFTEEHARPAFQAEQEIIRTGQPMVNLEEKITHMDGRVGWVLTSKMPWRDPAGNIIGTFGISRDITERKVAEEALRESEERFSNAFQHAPIGVALVAPDGRWLKVNRALCTMTGYTPVELLSRTFQDITHPEDLGRDLESLRAILAGEMHSYQMEKRYFHAHGHVITVLLNVSLIRDAQGRPLYFISQIQDITERKLAEQEAERSLRRLTEAQRIGQIGDWEWDIATQKITWSPQVFQIYGRDPRLGPPRDYEQNAALYDAASRAHMSEKIALAIASGQNQDYELVVVKPDGQRVHVQAMAVPKKDESGKVVGLYGTVQDITERKRVEQEIRFNEQRYRSLVDATAAIVWDTPASGEFEAAQPAWSKFTGQTFEELRGWGWLNAIHPDDRAETARVWSAAVADRVGYAVEHRLWARDQTYHDMQVRAVPILAEDGTICQWIGVHTDITERKKLEAQLFQSQKMETVGKLAGGIAHEFNSILTAIIGQSELLLNDLPPSSRLTKNAAEITQAAQRAATLTRQLLAYGRKQILQPEMLDFNRILKGMEGVLRHLVGMGVDLQIVPAPGLKAVKADAGQIEQVILNIVINAREAMPQGGKLTLETANVAFDENSVGRYPGLKPGDYVMLAISDNGVGMSEAVKARAFEPFFSTKGVGEGTGLGLSTCYGIVQQSGGHISVYSEEGRGTTFKIYLPQAGSMVSAPRMNSPDLPRGTETVLLVEDDAALREMAATLLRRLGYTVLAAANGIEALSLKHDRHTGHVDLLFTDVVMPHMSGKELADRVHALSPQTKILFASAYTENAIVHHGVLDKGVALLQKPFTPAALAGKLREVLDGGHVQSKA